MKHNWEYIKLEEGCVPKKLIKRASKHFKKDDIIEYIDISSIDRSSHLISSTSSYIFADAPSRAQQCVEKNDVLVSLVRPNLKNIAIINDYSENLVASSGFCVLKGRVLIPKFVYYIVTSSVFTEKLVSKCAGAAYPAVNEDDVRNILVPKPPVDTQEKIVTELDKINEIISDCKEAIRNLDSLAQSLFYDYFGDPITNPKGWPTLSLGEICNIVGRIGFRGYTQNDLVKKGEGAITLSPSNIVNGNLNYDKCSYVSWYKYNESPEIKIRNGDVILTKTGSTVGKVACVNNLPEKATLNPQLVVLKNLSINNLYLTYTLQDNAYQEIIREKSRGSAVPTISQKMLATIAVQVPPQPLQEKFAKKVEQIEQQKKGLEETIANMQTLLDSRMDYWFS